MNSFTPEIVFRTGWNAVFYAVVFLLVDWAGWSTSDYAISLSIGGLIVCFFALYLSIRRGNA